MDELKPNNTIYINNLNEKVKPEELKKALYAIFSQFGKIVDIMCFTSVRMRGQAHLIFKEMNSAIIAMRSMQGFPFHDKPLRIQFARRDSDIIAKDKGTYTPREPKTFPQYLTKKQKRKAMKKATVVEAKKLKEEPMDTSTSDVGTPPNKILFCTDLPPNTDKEMLRLLFGHFQGLIDIRLIPNRNDIAFVEFEDETRAAVAKRGLHNYRLSPTLRMCVEFAKK